MDKHTTMRKLRSIVRSTLWIITGSMLFVYICSVVFQNQSDFSESIANDPKQLQQFTYSSIKQQSANLQVKDLKHNHNIETKTRVNLKETGSSDIDGNENRELASSRDMDNTVLNPDHDLDLICSGPRGRINGFLDALFSSLSTLYDKIVTRVEHTKEVHSDYAFNYVQSRKLALNRSIVETRSQECMAYDPMSTFQYSSVSIIIPFHNEEYSVLLRTLHNIYLKTPDYLIGEVILIDDKSTLETVTTSPFENYVAKFPNLKLYRNRQRQGLIRTRILGARLATSNVILFMDAHVECQSGWLPPLLRVLESKPTAIAVPTLDYINPYTMQYTPWSRPEYGLFTWDLEFIWKDIPADEYPKDRTAPIASPVTIGCAMAMKRDYFFSIGGYDDDMWIWGGENIEISFRAWLCGGGVYIAQCSHVGHLFRPVLPYSFPVPNAIAMNLQRVAETWMEEYKQYYYQTAGNRETMTHAQTQSLKRRQNLKSTLQCRSFKWYLENVIKDMPAPTNNSMLFGQMTNLGNRLCLSSQDGVLHLASCPILNINQSFYYNKHTMQLIHYASQKCIKVKLNRDLGLDIVMEDCSSHSDSFEKWLFDPLIPTTVLNSLQGTQSKRPSGSFKLQLEGKYNNCLKMTPKVYSPDNSQKLHYFTAEVELCNANDNAQYWMFTYRINQ